MMFLDMEMEIPYLEMMFPHMEMMIPHMEMTILLIRGRGPG
jgi:hypothetical protein